MFDETSAIDGAMRQFWRHGYAATSTRELCKATGVPYSSLYNAFDSKHDLFLRALERYLDVAWEPQSDILADESRPAVQRLREVMRLVVAHEVANRVDGRNIGCLSVNATVELAGRDDAVDSLLRHDAQRRIDAMARAIGVGQASGEIRVGGRPSELARFLNAVIAGMRVSAQGGASPATLRRIASIGVDGLSA